MGVNVGAKLLYGIHYKRHENVGIDIDELIQLSSDNFVIQEYYDDHILAVEDSVIESYYSICTVDDLAINTTWYDKLLKFCVQNNILFKPPHYYFISYFC
jgi:hypothetical protein